MTMDYKRFQEWLSGIDQHSPAFLGPRIGQLRWLPLKQAWVKKIASARIVAYQALYRVARQGVCGGRGA